MTGFAQQRRNLLEAELRRVIAELPSLGIERAFLTGDFARGAVWPETGLEFVVVHKTEQPFHRRPDFFVSHVLPRVNASWFVYTPDEFEELAEVDPILIHAMQVGEEIYAG